MNKIWSNEDPRIVNYLNNYVYIIVCRGKHGFPGTGEVFISDCYDKPSSWVIYLKFVNTEKHVDSIFDIIKLEADEEWNPDWYWTYAPA